MGVDAEDAPGELVGHGLADQGGAGLKERLDHGRRLRSRRVGRGPVGIAAARDMAFDIENVLGGEAEAGKRSVRGPFGIDRAAGGEGVERVGHGPR